MALPVQEQLKSLLESSVKKPQLILEIDGLPTFSSIPAQKYALFGDPITYGMSGLVYGGLFNDDTVFPYIDLNKSTRQISQQMLVDKGGFSSVTTFDVSIVDKDQLITQLITPGHTIADILGVKAKLYLSVEGAGHPKDSILFFAGIVSGVKSGAGFININLASPEKLKNLEIFPKFSTEITANVNTTATTIPVTSTLNFVLPADSGTLRTYFLLNNEIIEYASVTSTSFTGCIRGAFGTIPSNHSTGDSLNSAYRLIGNLKDLCLKLMLSGTNTNYVSNESVVAINSYGSQNIANAIFVVKYNVDQYYGITAGDIITITDAINSANNGTARIIRVVQTDLGSSIILDKTLLTEGSGAKFSIKSKYAVLPKLIGLEMTPDQVDVQEFESKYNQFSASFFNYDFFIKDSVNGSDFIDTQILYPSGAYSLPRKAKTSLGLTIPPLAQSGTKKLDETNVISASGLQIDRTISKNFYNSIVYKFSKDQVTDKYKSGKIRQSSDSTNRIKIANKPLTIESDGIRSETGFDFKLNIQGRRFLERYQYAAESIPVLVNFGFGFDIEIGDSIIFDGTNLNVTDAKSGNATRNFQPRLFEVQNKTLDLSGRPIKLDLVDTAFSLEGRYGVISPSSLIDSGSTTTVLRLKKSYGTNLGFSSEGFKWKNYLGLKLKIRSKDHSFSHERTLVSIDPANDNGLIITPALPIIPLENYIVDVANYSTSTSSTDQSAAKSVFVYWNNEIPVLTGISQTEFTISNSYLTDIKIGFSIMVHSPNYSNTSKNVKVIGITGTTITVDTALGFVPSPQDKIERLGFVDDGKPYLWL